MGRGLATELWGQVSRVLTWESHSVSTSGEGGREEGRLVSQPPWDLREQRRRSMPGPDSPSSWETGLREGPGWDTADVLQGEGSMCPGSSGAHSLLPPLCKHVCEECTRASKPQHVPLQTFMLRNLPAGCPLPNPTGLQTPQGKRPSWHLWARK